MKRFSSLYSNAFGLPKKMEVVGKLIGPVVGLLTIIGYFSGAFDKVYHYFGDDMKIVVREQQFLQGATADQFHVAFSLVNSTSQTVYINLLTLHLGDYVIGGPPPTMMVFVQTFSNTLHIRLVKDLKTGLPMPIVSDTNSSSTMGTKVYSLLGTDRVALAPREQVDFRLDVELERPKEMSGKYDSIWKLGGTIHLEYERADLKRGSARYPYRPE
jgi:hypothetical protein